MKLKIPQTSAILLLIISTAQCQSINWNCEFDDAKFNFSNAFTAEHHEDYTCYLRSESTCPTDVPDLYGAHYHRRDNDDVKILSIFSNLKIFTSIFCEKFENLKIISVKNVDVEAMAENALRDCDSLDIAQFVRNEIREMPKKLLPLDSHLTQLRIHKNLIHTLPVNFFVNQQNLKILAIDKNRIVYLPVKIFHPLINLQYLTLADNELRVIMPHWFEKLEKLLELDLQNNHITKVPKMAFEKLRKLQKLWIGNNRLKSIDSNSFQGLQQLSYLNIENSHVTDLPSMLFVPLDNLNQLILTNNEITVVHGDSFGTANIPEIVDLSRNQIIAIDEDLSSHVDSSKFNITGSLCDPVQFDVDVRIMNNEDCYQNYESRPVPVEVVTNDTGTCGKRVKFMDDNTDRFDVRIINGVNAQHGEYPWTAVLFKSDGSYFCGGTLTSCRKIVTAAHCIQEKDAVVPLSISDFYVLFGGHDLSTRNQAGWTKHTVNAIHIHTEWSPFTRNFDSDIAVLELTQKVTFNEFIQPICLIEPNTYIASLTEGVVVGYGKSEDQSKHHENIPKLVDIPIQDDHYCLRGCNVLPILSSGRTFCGGSAHGEGVCKGDSGNGMVVSYGNVFYLRGIVSSAKFVTDSECDVYSYAVFTDMLKFNDWVNRL